MAEEFYITERARPAYVEGSDEPLMVLATTTGAYPEFQKELMSVRAGKSL